MNYEKAYADYLQREAGLDEDELMDYGPQSDYGDSYDYEYEQDYLLD
jgi:hypothetical protein